MAEGVEDTGETNNNHTSSCEGSVMLGAVMPSLAASVNFGAIKKELESACIASQIHHSPPSSDHSESRDRHHHHHHHHHHSHRDLKSEERDDDDRSNASTPHSHGSELRDQPMFHDRYRGDHDKSHLTKDNSNTTPLSLNGTMQDIINLQKLQNMSMFQHSAQMSGQLTGLQNLGNQSSSLLNSPLNLSVGGAAALPPAPNESAVSPQLPQLILASGQLIQGIQGAQLLIPTAQGVTTQTILTIPVSQQIASSITKEQIFQNLSQLINRPDSIPNPLQQLPLPQSPSILNSSNLLNTHFLTNNAQQLLQTIQPPNILPTLAAAAAAQHHQQSQQAAAAAAAVAAAAVAREHSTSKSSSSGGGGGGGGGGGSGSGVGGGGGTLSSHHDRKMHSSHHQHSRHSPLTGGREHRASHGSSRNERPKSHSPQPTNLSSSFLYDKIRESSGSSGGAARLTPIPERHADEREEHRKGSPMGRDSNRDSHSPNFSSRLPTTNGDLIITKSHLSHLSASSGSAAGPSASQSASPQSQPSNYHGMKMSPSRNHTKQPLSSPTGSENSGGDLLNDSPNELTINQTNCNVVDGIDLDEIKEFAKAFKLRRLSLGLTQTQVGQALSVTEGPAYSQSAICSALAAQMYAAAQISSQQQQMFEKLDITPKSAQKIKPVLEKWMKEAEERYKTGQNHLTDFIGVEPSKKRKRRTSFTPQALELLNAHFERNTHPSGTEITGLAHQLGYEREVIRIWFCNKRQALKNTVRMMSKGMV